MNKFNCCLLICFRFVVVYIVLNRHFYGLTFFPVGDGGVHTAGTSFALDIGQLDNRVIGAAEDEAVHIAVTGIWLLEANLVAYREDEISLGLIIYK